MKIKGKHMKIISLFWSLPIFRRSRREGVSWRGLWFVFDEYQWTQYFSVH